MGHGYRSGGVAVKVGAAEGAILPKILTAIWLAACTAVALAALVFAAIVAFRDGPIDPDWPLLGVALGATVPPLIAAWYSLRRGGWLVAVALGALPVVLVVYAISQIRIRMF